jgi:methionine biosynthesis protein MetW
MVRVGRRGIVSFPNCAYWRRRWRLLREGRSVTGIGETWHDTPDLRNVSVRDFLELCRLEGLVVEQCIGLGPGRRRLLERWPNVFAEQAVFVVRRA